MARMYPVFLTLQGKAALVVGGGAVALRKVQALLECGARVRVVALSARDEIRALAREGRLELHLRAFAGGDCRGAFLVFAATGDSAVNAAVFREAESLGLPVNSVDDPANCNFFVPAVAQQGDLLVAVNTQGQAPLLAQRVRDYVQRLLPEGVGQLVADMAELRGRLKREVPDAAERARRLREWLQEQLRARNLPL
ncbi:MAG: bifunctional precorrin-2 dehydrogenase/sirohydrochlorin ferrochelatase [Planctomycetes bacterium]|nr:bifunctional precorrin-2 dehydrogenase/sirohydrochlorin ferrochelatase [Planctomycetota bacterium]